MAFEPGWGKNTLTIWTCTTYGDQMPLETVVGRSFEEVAEPCRQSLREMDWLEQDGPPPIETAEQIADAWGETFDGFCVIRSHEI